MDNNKFSGRFSDRFSGQSSGRNSGKGDQQDAAQPFGQNAESNQQSTTKNGAGTFSRRLIGSFAKRLSAHDDAKSNEHGGEQHAADPAAKSSSAKHPGGPHKNSRIALALIVQACTVLGIAALAALAAFLIFFRAPAVVSVPDLVGKPFVEAAVLLQEKRLYPNVLLQYTNDPLDKDSVVKQDPQPGMAIRAGREVSVTISRGVVLEQLPDYQGEKYSAIIDRIAAQYASLSSFVSLAGARKLFRDDVPPDVIVAQDPPAGSKITGKDTALSFVVSRGSRSMQSVMPDVTGLRFDEIYDILQGTTFPVEFYLVERDIVLPTEQGSPQRKAGVIVEQLPSPGVSLSGMADDFRVRFGIRPADVPRSIDAQNQQNNQQNIQSVETAAAPSYRADILKISLPRYNEPRALVIRRRANAQASAAVEQSVSLTTRGGTVTFPYFVIPGALYEAQTDGATVWRYAVPESAASN